MDAMTIAWLVLLLAQPAPDDYDVVVVCPAVLRPSLAPWLEHRTQQGHRIDLVSGDQEPTEVRRQIQQANRRGGLRYVVLVGDAEPNAGGKGLGACVPPHYFPARVNVHWGSEPEIATDNGYADLNGDGIPDVAVGRLPAKTPDELRTLLAKIVAYEQSRDFGPWRRQVKLVAGVGNLGALVDMVVESAARYFILHGIPETCELGIIQSNWRSPYCPDPRQYHRTVIDSLNDGALLWAYMGHSNPQCLAPMETPAGWCETFSVRDVPELRARPGRCVAVLLSCYAGRFDGPDDCLAERMLLAPGGPVAVLAGSRVTMPYGMAVMANELMRLCFRQQAATLGEAVLGAKQRMFEAPVEEAEVRKTLDLLASAISPQPGLLEAERIEHVMMFNLLGDPLLRLPHPKPLPLDPPGTPAAGATLVVRGESPMAGRCTVELIVAPGRLAHRPAPRTTFPQTDSQMSQLQEDFLRANNQRLASATADVPEGRFEMRLPVPSSCQGSCYLRAFVEGTDDFAAGAVAVRVGEAKAKKLSQGRDSEATPSGGTVAVTETGSGQ